MALSGERCKSPPLRGSDKCGLHTPGMAAKLGAKGGRRRAVFDPAQLADFDPPRSAQELGLLMATTMIEVRQCRLEPRVANALSCLASGFLACLAHGDMEERLKLLETQYADRRRHAQHRG